MKLIIDIPDIDYRHIKGYYEKNDIVEATYSYIYHGIPLDEVLDKIRDEIEQKIPNVEYDIGNGLAIAISIIDKYRGEQE